MIRPLSQQIASKVFNDNAITNEEAIALQKALLEIEEELREEKTIDFADFVELCAWPTMYFDNNDYTIDSALTVAYANFLKRNVGLRRCVDAYNNLESGEQKALESRAACFASMELWDGGEWQLFLGVACLLLGPTIMCMFSPKGKLLGVITMVVGGAFFYWSDRKSDEFSATKSPELLKEMDVEDLEIRFEFF